MLVLTENDVVSVFLAKELYSPLFPMKYASKHTQNRQHVSQIFSFYNSILLFAYVSEIIIYIRSPIQINGEGGQLGHVFFCNFF